MAEFPVMGVRPATLVALAAGLLFGLAVGASADARAPQAAVGSTSSLALTTPDRIVPFRPFEATVQAGAPGQLKVRAQTGDRWRVLFEGRVGSGPTKLTLISRWLEVRSLSASLALASAGSSKAEVTVAKLETATRRRAYPVVGRVKQYDLGSSWKPGCPARAKQLRRLNVNHVNYSGHVKRGEIIVHKRVIGTVRTAFVKAYKHDFRIKSMIPIDRFGGSDNRSMRADNTSGYACGKYESGRWARHAYGDALDINPRKNPHVFSNRLLPRNASRFVDRRDLRKGMLGRRSEVTRVFTEFGWTWGGTYQNPDYQHFSLTGG
jgi:hypothetical protein